MAVSTIKELRDFGQSVWLDNINRSMLLTGRLKRMIGLGLTGMTSNPTIFEKAIQQSSDYDEQISALCKGGASAFEIYDELTISDIRGAADLFLPVYKASGGKDGYVSLEINPKLAYDSQRSVEEGKRLFEKVNRPNVMFKVPATEPGFQAVEELVSQGRNINITLIFSLEQYSKTAEAYLRGINRFINNNGDPSNVFSVASVFVSRIDTLVDGLLDWFIANEHDPEKREGIMALKGRAAVANSAAIYAKYSKIFNGMEFLELKKKEVNPQRLLWGSTSTKNAAYSDIKYVTELIARDTVNTMPEHTFSAFLDHGLVKEALSSDAAWAQPQIDSLKDSGIHINEVCSCLLKEGIAAFMKSFDSLLAALEEKKKILCRV